ncbi:hypothetical protein Bca52824_035037 [Brassica carinata]|uniref:Uncharacterized protein n=1 Tax=Brassica carinata TaxID=52824 RepID=A0A8X7S1Z7_BRACI|nr:hypothetical protein Bca52824_035037 [Brassica carinata]
MIASGSWWLVEILVPELRLRTAETELSLASQSLGSRILYRFCGGNRWGRSKLRGWRFLEWCISSGVLLPLAVVLIQK